MTGQHVRKEALFPTSISSAYSYASSGYQQRDTLANGPGYWLKFSTAETITLAGAARTLDTVDVVAGWNLIGSLSGAVPISTIVQAPLGIVVSSYYGYVGSGYVATDTFFSGKGYWVKVNENGTLILATD